MLKTIKLPQGRINQSRIISKLPKPNYGGGMKRNSSVPSLPANNSAPQSEQRSQSKNGVRK